MTPNQMSARWRCTHWMGHRWVKLRASVPAFDALSIRPGALILFKWKVVGRRCVRCGIAHLLAAKRAEGFTGKLNIYTCDICRGHIVTRDVDDGVTPYSTACYATPGCDGWMKSSMYRVFDQSMRESHQWHRPESLDGLSPGARTHFERGGLFLREAVFNDGRSGSG